MCVVFVLGERGEKVKLLSTHGLEGGEALVSVLARWCGIPTRKCH